MTARKVLSITGADRHGFLQGLITNDVAKLDDGLVYAALLTPQGKYLADFLLKEQGDAILLDVSDVLADELTRRLSMYRLRADVEISISNVRVSQGTGPSPDGALPDPRHPALGWRAYDSDAPFDDGTDWTAIRVANCIPETGVELTPETYILEAGFERLNGVDFRKGCYVGQEITARMKHKTELRKGLAVVSITGSAPIGCEITSDGKSVGTLFSQSGGQAIAHLRFDRAKGEMLATDARLSWAG